jgi:hypothetical protein
VTGARALWRGTQHQHMNDAVRALLACVYKACMGSANVELADFDTPTLSALLCEGKYKLLVGKPGGEWQASWYGEFSPNATTPHVNENFFACG